MLGASLIYNLFKPGNTREMALSFLKLTLSVQRQCFGTYKDIQYHGDMRSCKFHSLDLWKTELWPHVGLDSTKSARPESQLRHALIS